MTRKGHCWDNAVAESTIGTIKAELLGEQVPEDLYEVRRMLFPYIEGFYNRRRLHSSLGYSTPSEKEAVAQATRNVASGSCPSTRGKVNLALPRLAGQEG